MNRTIQTRTIVTLRERVDALLDRAEATGDDALASSLEIASAALSVALEGRA